MNRGGAVYSIELWNSNEQRAGDLITCGLISGQRVISIWAIDLRCAFEQQLMSSYLSTSRGILGLPD